MNIKEFRYINLDDPFDSRYVDHWSRPYEYKMVLDFIKSNTPEKIPSVHNTSWGGPHVVPYNELSEKKCHHRMFRSDLDRISCALHSEYIIPEDENVGTYYYDITHEPDESLKERFDFVLSVSTMEHLPAGEWPRIMKNLMSQVKPGGHMIMTFDSNFWGTHNNPDQRLGPFDLGDGNLIYINKEEYSTINQMEQHQLWTNKSQEFLEKFLNKECQFEIKENKNALLNGATSKTRTEKSQFNFWLHSIFLVVEKPIE